LPVRRAVQPGQKSLGALWVNSIFAGAGLAQQQMNLRELPGADLFLLSGRHVLDVDGRGQEQDVVVGVEGMKTQALPGFAPGKVSTFQQACSGAQTGRRMC
jgi:hypothetical protein